MQIYADLSYNFCKIIDDYDYSGIEDLWQVLDKCMIDQLYDYQRLVVILIRLMPMINAELLYDFCKIIHECIRVIRTVLRLIRIMYDRRNIVVRFIKIQYDSS